MIRDLASRAVGLLLFPFIVIAVAACLTFGGGGLTVEGAPTYYREDY